MKVVHIGGAKGVGKTTTVGELGSLAIPGYTMLSITASNVLSQGAQAAFGRPWSALTDSEKNESRGNFRDILASLPADVVFLDSHYIDMEDGVPRSIMSSEISEAIDLHIVLEAGPSQILERRMGDISNRPRDLDLGQIEIEVQAERAEAVRLAGETGSPVHIFDNIDVGESARRIVEISRDFLFNTEGRISYEGTVYNRK
jgi:adenylate kinase